MAKITFEDKISLVTNDLPVNGKLTAANANEIKNSVNALYDTANWIVELDDTFQRSFKQPYAQTLKIVSTSSSAVQTISIQVGGVAYTLGDPIEQWDEITVIGEVESTVNLSIEAVL